MAIRVQPFFSIVLRPFVPQNVSRRGWTLLVHQAASGLFDGEIMVFVAMSMTDIKAISATLERSGFRSSSQDENPDYAVFDRGYGVMPNWLEQVDVLHFSDKQKKDVAWKMVHSEIYTLHDHGLRSALPTKGYDVDWYPLIGKLNES